jgi:hypothetical protein
MLDMTMTMPMRMRMGIRTGVVTLMELQPGVSIREWLQPWR